MSLIVSWGQLQNATQVAGIRLETVDMQRTHSVCSSQKLVLARSTILSCLMDQPMYGDGPLSRFAVAQSLYLHRPSLPHLFAFRVLLKGREERSRKNHGETGG